MKKISDNITQKLQLMIAMSQESAELINDIVKIINDMSDVNSLVNIRLKIEWLIKQFDIYYKDSISHGNIKNILTESLSDIDKQISVSNVNNLKLEQIKINLDQFKNNFKTEESKLNSNDNKRMTEVILQNSNTNIKQTGGTYKLCNANDIYNKKYQIGGGNIFIDLDMTEINKLSNITNWLDFFPNIKQWPEKNKNIFHNIKINFYMCIKILYELQSKYENQNNNPYDTMLNMSKNMFEISKITNFDFNRSLKGLYKYYNEHSDKRELLLKKIDSDKFSILNIIEILLYILLNNYNTVVNNDMLNKCYLMINNINVNLSENLFYKKFIDKIIDCNNDKLLNNIKIKYMLQKNDIQKLTYNDNLKKTPQEYNNIKTTFLKSAFEYNFYAIWELFNNAKDNLDNNLIEFLDEFKINYDNYTLGIEYGNNYMYSLKDYFDLKTDSNIDFKNEDKIDYAEIFNKILKFRNAIYIDSNNSKKLFNMIKIINDNDIILNTKIDMSLIDEFNNNSLNNTTIDKFFSESNEKLSNSLISYKRSVKDKIETLMTVLNEYNIDIIKNKIINYTKENQANNDQLLTGFDVNNFKAFKREIFDKIIDNTNNKIVKDFLISTSKMFNDDILKITAKYTQKLTEESDQKKNIEKLQLSLNELNIKKMKESDALKIEECEKDFQNTILQFYEEQEKYNIILNDITKLDFDKSSKIEFLDYINEKQRENEFDAIIQNNKTLIALDFAKLKKKEDIIHLKNSIDVFFKSMDGIKDYDELKCNLNSYINYFDKITTETLNAVKVFVKARHESIENKSDKYKYTDKCITVTDSKMEQFGQFEKVYWADTSLADLYCGEGINCSKKIPMTKSIRDTIQTGCKSNIYYTYGFSGSGKTTMLLGRKSGDPNASRGVISRMLEDVLDDFHIDRNGKEIKINYLIGEIYGEKANLSLLDNKYYECMYIWDIKTFEDKTYIHNLTKDKDDDKINNFLKTINILKSEKNDFYEKNKMKFDFDDLDILKQWTSETENKINFETTKDLNKLISLSTYGSADIDNYKSNFNVMSYVNNENKKETLYELLNDNKNYHEFKYNVRNKENIIEASKLLSEELDKNIDKIQQIRRKKNRVRCTKYNPDSSRSHMFFILKINKKNDVPYYYVFIDKAGSEIPYEIAANEFVKLANDVDLNKPFLNIDFKSIKNINFEEQQILKNIKKTPKNPTTPKQPSTQNATKTQNADINEFIKNELNKQKIFTNENCKFDDEFLNNSTAVYLICGNDDPSNNIKIKDNKIKIQFDTNNYMEGTISIDSVEYDKKKIDTRKTGEYVKYNIFKMKIQILFETHFEESKYNIKFQYNQVELTDNDNFIYKFDILKSNKNNEYFNKINELFAKSFIKKNMKQMIFYDDNTQLNSSETKKYIDIKQYNTHFSKLLNSFAEFINLKNIDDGTKNEFVTYADKMTNKQNKEFIEINIKSFKDLLIKKFLFIETLFKNDKKFNFMSDFGKNKQYIYIFSKGSTIDIFDFNMASDQYDVIVTNIIKNVNYIIKKCKDLNNTELLNIITQLKLLKQNINNKYNIDNNDPIDALEITKFFDENIFTEEHETDKKRRINRKIESLTQMLKKIIENIYKIFDFIDIIKFKKNFIDNFDATYKNITITLTDDQKTNEQFKKNAVFEQLKNIAKKLFIDFSQVAFNSTIDIAEPSTDDLYIDYKKLLSSYFFQHAFLSNIKNSPKYGCNSNEIIKSIDIVRETLSFLFDNYDNNMLTKHFVNIEFPKYEAANVINHPELNFSNDMFDENPTEIISWLTNLKNNSDIENLAKLNNIFDLIKVDYFEIQKLTEIKINKSNNQLFINTAPIITPPAIITQPVIVNPPVNAALSSTSSLSPPLPNVNINIKNFITRLVLISKLHDNLSFLNIFKNKTHIIPIHNINALIDVFNMILWNNYDKITYIKEFENLFNKKLYLELHDSKYTEQKYIDKKEIMRVEQEKWNIINNYSNIWKNIANKIIPSYLLNVKQGFWINHSIRQFMRTIMYTTDNKWINDKDIFDNEYTNLEKKEEEQQAIINTLFNNYDNKIKVGKNLIKNIKKFNFNKFNEEIQNNFANKIFENTETIEEYYLDNYDVKNSIWLKLLLTIQHLGSNKSPVMSNNAKNDTDDELKSFDVNINEDVHKLTKFIKYDKKYTDEYYVSKNITLLLALSTRKDKVQGTKKTLEFADLISQISNPTCDTNIMSGGNIHQKKYKLTKI
jgi:hypothetical protein